MMNFPCSGGPTNPMRESLRPTPSGETFPDGLRYWMVEGCAMRFDDLTDAKLHAFNFAHFQKLDRISVTQFREATNEAEWTKTMEVKR